MSVASEPNPFSTRFTRPGAIDYQFAVDGDRTQLVDKLAANRWMGQIVGPHGSGKSTLLAALLPRLEQRGKRILSITLHSGERRLDWIALNRRRWDRQTLVIVDGYEQLGWHHRWKLRRRVRKSSAGLLVTTHRCVRLPLICETTTSAALLSTLVDTLAPHHSFSTAMIQACFQQHDGNLREALFTLYDRWESA